ncbi:TPA: WG repeat-containing protein [Streptococcus suis]|nr:WG repeat-containing protein [Streptococcus suis]
MSLLLLKKNGLFGLMTVDGKMLFPPLYSEISEYSNGLIAVRKDKLWGYLDEEGQVAIPFQFTEAKKFSSKGAAPVKFNHSPSSWGIIDRTGKQLNKKLAFDQGYHAISEFSEEGLAIAQHYKTYCLLGEDGQIVNNQFYASIHKLDLSNTYLIRELSSYIAVNEDMDVIFRSEKSYDEIYSMSHGMRQVVMDDLVGYVDETGREVIPCQYQLAYEFAENGLAPAQFDNGLFGYINKQNEAVIAPQFDDASVFVGGLAPVSKDGNTWFINEKGEDVFGMTFADASHFAGGLSNVTLHTGQTAFINTSGQIVFYYPSEWEVEKFTSKDITTFKVGDEVGIINKQGDVVVSACCESLKVSEFGNLHPYKQNGLWGYIDGEGNIVFKNQFLQASTFGSNGLASVQMERAVAVEDQEQETEEDDDIIIEMDEERSVIWNIVNEDGQILFQSEDLDFLSGFGSSPYAYCVEDDKYYFINAEGVRFGKGDEFMSTFSDGEAIALQSGYFKYLDALGQELNLDKFGMVRLSEDFELMVDLDFEVEEN